MDVPFLKTSKNACVMGLNYLKNAFEGQNAKNWKRFGELVKNIRKCQGFYWKVLVLTMQNKANTSLIKTLKNAYVMGRVGVAVEAIVGAPVGIEPINKVF